MEKIWEQLCKLRKNCHHKQNINRMLNEQLQYNCLQQLWTLRLKSFDLRKLGNPGERK